MTSLIGREADIAAVMNLLNTGDARCVTLLGPGGVGKTRLAIAVAHVASQSFADGACFVELAPVTEPEVVLASLMQSLGIAQVPGHANLQLLQDNLRRRDVLLVLDNLEQVLEAAPLIFQVLATAPGVKAIVTSREPLQIAGEQRYAVPPLSFAGESERSTAVELFVQRARAFRADFALNESNAATVVDICRRLDGLPLALELAAARVALFTPREMLLRLNQGLPMLANGTRDLPARQRTLRATLDWSYNLLTPNEQALFRRLSVFASGLRLHAVKRFCQAGELTLDAVEGLTALVTKNLVVQTIGGDGTSRYTMLGTIREYALSQLIQLGERDVWMRPLAAHLLGLARFASMNGCQLLEDVDNWRAAIQWTLSNASMARLGLMLCQKASQFGVGNKELMGWQQKALANSGAAQHPREQSQVLAKLGNIQRVTGEIHIFDALEQSLDLCRLHGFDPLAIYVLQELGMAARERGDADRARGYFQECLKRRSEIDDDYGIINVLVAQAEVEVLAEQPTTARGFLDQALSLLHTHPNLAPADLRARAWIQNHLAHVALLESDLRAAEDWINQSIQTLLLSELVWANRDFGLAWGHQFAGEIALTNGDTALAARHLTQGFQLATSYHDQISTVWCLATLAGVAALDEEPEQGARLWAASEAIREKIHCRIGPASRRNREHTVALLRQQLGDAEFVRLVAEGAKLTLEQAVDAALQT